MRAPAALVALLFVAAAPARTDWSQTVAVTPAGSFIRGNPQAKVKLVEYASFTCSHCAAFATESKATLGQWLRAGQVSIEYRQAIRDRFDLAAALIARCTGPKHYLAVSDTIFARQNEWLARAAYLPEPDENAPVDQTLGVIARGVGLDQVAGGGLPPAKVGQCLADKAEQDRLAKMRTEAWGRISGTPSFLLNGRLVADVYSWDKLEPALRAALK